MSGTDADTCVACLARPPRLARIRSAFAYGDLSRKLALRLKYGRKVAVAATMARYMSPLLDGSAGDAVLAAVPLHRGRLTNRGFNQSTLIAREIAKRTGLSHDPFLLRRIKRTPPLKGMSRSRRRRAVAGAFSIPDKSRVDGRTVILIDDVLTTGSTANACARALKRAGAARVELISWARVVRSSELDR